MQHNVPIEIMGPAAVNALALIFLAITKLRSWYSSRKGDAVTLTYEVEAELQLVERDGTAGPFQKWKGKLRATPKPRSGQ